MYSILSPKFLENWTLFVNTCKLILRPALQQIDVDNAHSYFLKFLIGCEKFYLKITINQHLQAHLKEAIENFSVPYAFCLFSFELCNGYLGLFNTNNRNVELTFMKRFWDISRLKANLTRILAGIINSSSSSTASISLLNEFKEYLDDQIFSQDTHFAHIKKQQEDGYDPITFLEFLLTLKLT